MNASIVSALVKITGQTAAVDSHIDDEEKMLVVARVLLVEQLIGALGGWQDPCVIFPGVKLLSTEPGDFLPQWRPVEMPDGAWSRLRGILKLTDGCYRQPSETAAWQFTGLWVMRLAEVYEARMKTRALLEHQLDRLEAGRIERIGEGESADWKHRCAISPKATNLYIERVIERMKESLGEANVDFDACGARGGAGGCWWINRDAVSDEQFEAAFFEVSADAMAQFQGQIRFEGDPRVYDYECNDVGLEIEVKNL